MWTPEEVELLRELYVRWRGDLVRIAARLGRTTDSVTGKVHRLSLRGGGRGASPPPTRGPSMPWVPPPRPPVEGRTTCSEAPLPAATRAACR